MESVINDQDILLYTTSLGTLVMWSTFVNIILKKKLLYTAIHITYLVQGEMIAFQDMT